MPDHDHRPYAVLDIDGVLANVQHRLHYLETRPKDWHGFFTAAPADPPLKQGLATAEKLAADHEVVYLTGRPEWCRADTQDWLERYELPPGRLLMRRSGDRRPARLAKLDFLRQLAKQRPVAILVDDDPQVCQTATAAGFEVLEATWMTRPDVLDVAQEKEGRT